MQLADVIRSLRHHWRASVALVALTGVALGVFLFTRNETREPERWEASVQLLVPHRSEDGELPEGVPPQLLQGQQTVALSPETTDAALDAAGLSDDDRGSVTFDFSSSERGDIHTVTVTGPTEEQAEALANSYAAAYQEARRDLVAEGSLGRSAGARANLEILKARLAEVEDELRRADPDLLASLPDTADPSDEDEAANDEQGGDDVQGAAVDLPPSTPVEVQLLAAERADILQRIEDVRRAYARSSTDTLVPSSHATIVERVTPEQITPPPPSPLIPIGAAIALATLLALGVPVLLDRIDHSIRDSYAAGNALAAPVLSTIPVPPSSRLATLARPESPRGYAFRTLATASVATDQLPRAIVVTAPVGHMQDSVAANFAAALADLGLRVALLPTDPRQAWYADAPEGAPTLPDFLELAYTGRLNGEVPHQLVTTPVDNLRVLPHDDTEADALIDGLPPLLRAFADGGVDVTVIAGPSILEDPSATILAWSTRSVLWVVEAGEVTQQQASEAAERLELAGASPFGVALIDGKA